MTDRDDPDGGGPGDRPPGADGEGGPPDAGPDRSSDAGTGPDSDPDPGSAVAAVLLDLRPTGAERVVGFAVLAFGLLLAGLLVAGFLSPSYFLYLLALAAMYVMLSTGLNVQWGYTGLINFSVAAFFGVGAYAAALLASGDSPLTGGAPVVLGGVSVPLQAPLFGFGAAMAVAAVLAVLIGVPTLSLRADYLAIASLGLAEVVRILIKNQPNYTGGTRGVLGMPTLFAGLPAVGPAVEALPTGVLNAAVAVALALAVWLFVRYVHRSPWGRAQRLVRSDEDLAEALGKDTFRLRLQSFVIGSVIMALAGVVYVHLNDSLFPTALNPIRTFYVWIAVILGGAGSDRGAVLGGGVIVTVVEGSRFAGDVGLPVEAGTLRLFVVGAIIITVMHFRPQGVLPPQRELVWPSALAGRSRKGRSGGGGSAGSTGGDAGD